MSEFRMFSWGFVLGDGLLAAALDHANFKTLPGDPYAQFLFTGVLVGCLAVICFGKRGA